MYFEPAKRTYYRFPSSNSIHQMDSRCYFPEKTFSSGENTRQEAELVQVTEQENFLTAK